MNVICTSLKLINILHPNQGITDILGAGFENLMLDISGCCSKYELEAIGQPSKEKKYKSQALVSKQPSKLHTILTPMLDKCRESHLNIAIAYAPYLSRDTKHDDLNELLRELTIESIKACGQAGCKYIIVRPLFAGVKKDEEFEVNREYYLSLVETAKQNNVAIFLENQCRNLGGRLVRGVCADAYTAAEWIDKLNSEAGEELFGFCMNTGVCNLCGQDMREYALALGTRLKAVILRECDGHNEASLLPFTCVDNGRPQTDWLNFIRGLRELSFDGQLIIDFSDTAAAFSPLLKPQLIKLAKSVADYFKWQIEIETSLKKYNKIVLFGAGNMCRNYMKCYGEKYPPLFTCDNNKALWGTEFCGLEVKVPEALKELPDDCCVLICNIYYREIEKQLRDMGVKNIAFFNDEYMPSFHFDRIERRD